MTASPTLTPADLATELGTDPRTARKFLRSITPRDEQPGKGARWEIKGTKTNIAAMRKKFSSFQEAAEAAKKAKADKAPEVPETDTEDEVLEADDSLDSLEGPTDAELDEVDTDD